MIEPLREERRAHAARRCVALLCVGALAPLASACKTREIGGGELKLVFSDDFERAELGPDWVRGEGEGGAGTWRVEGGWVVADNIKNDPLWWAGKLPDRARVEFDARSLSAEGDLKCEIFGDGRRHESGYIVIFGGWSNALDVIARLDEHGEDRKAQRSRKVEQGKTHHFVIERGEDGALVWSIDGQQVMRYEDASPLTGPGHRGFAFNDWTAPVAFDNFKVYRLP